MCTEANAGSERRTAHSPWKARPTDGRRCRNLGRTSGEPHDEPHDDREDGLRLTLTRATFRRAPRFLVSARVEFLRAFDSGLVQLPKGLGLPDYSDRGRAGALEGAALLSTGDGEAAGEPRVA